MLIRTIREYKTPKMLWHYTPSRVAKIKSEFSKLYQDEEDWNSHALLKEV
jgi:hypothetical protein